MKFGYAIIETGMGWMGILGSELGLRQIVLPRAYPQAVIIAFDEHLEEAADDIYLFGDLTKRLIAYFNGEVVTFPDLLDLTDFTPFQCAVWQVVRSIPYGQTESYAWVAQRVAKPQGVRAAGQALARNPLPIVVPCHRVIGARGEIGGFSYGLQMKQHLLQLETTSLARRALDGV
jgi:methylated-DNA-[protein]-cysteine S-methyltransferase